MRTRVRGGFALLAIGGLVAGVLALVPGANNSTVASAAPSPNLEDSFAVLRSPANGDAVIPDAVKRAFTPRQLRDARAIKTVHGTGWVVPDYEREALCLAIPDPVDGYGYTCQGARSAVGGSLFGQMVSPVPSKASEIVAVVPDGAPAPRLKRQSGAVQSLQPDDSIVAYATTDPVEITLHGTDGESVTVPMRTEPQGVLTQDCGNGKVIVVKVVGAGNC